MNFEIYKKNGKPSLSRAVQKALVKLEEEYERKTLTFEVNAPAKKPSKISQTS